MFAVGMKKRLEGIYGFEVEKPVIEEDNQVLIKVLQAGIDGTDRAIVRWNLLDTPPEDDYMILGHEMVGQVEKVGSGVNDLKVGDIVVPTVRRGCGQCASCFNNQSDMCSTGLYKERGIHKLHGYFTEYIVEEEEYLVQVPPIVKNLAVLAEPLSISEKALEVIKHIQSRLPWSCAHPEHRYDEHGWGHCKNALVIGIGPLGFLATCLLKLDGIHAFAVINRPKENLKVQLIEKLGAHYIDGRTSQKENILNQTNQAGPLDIIIESSGASQLALELINGLARNGIYVFTGLPRGESRVCLDGDLLLRQIVRNNQVIVGSVNSNRGHFKQAIKHLEEMKESFGPVIEKAITDRYPLTEYKEAFAHKDPEQIKVVFEIGDENS